MDDKNREIIEEKDVAKESDDIATDKVGKSESDIFDMLRRRGDERELEKIFKANIFGGYSKKQITDYIESVERQSRKMEEVFQANFKEVSDEKEDLKRQLDQSEKYIRELEERNNQLHMDNASYDKKSIQSYEAAILKVKDNLDSVKEQNDFLKTENEKLHAKAASDKKHMDELEEKYKQMTAKLLSYEGTGVEEAKEKISALEKELSDISLAMSAKNQELTSIQKIKENQIEEIATLSKAVENFQEIEKNDKDTILRLKDRLIEKAEETVKNAKRYELNIKELEEKQGEKLLRLESTIQKVQTLLAEKDMEIKNLKAQAELSLTEVKQDYQSKVDSLMKNLLQKDTKVSELAKALEESAHALRLAENESLSLKDTTFQAKKNLEESMGQLSELSERGRAMLLDIDSERSKGVSLLKEKIKLDLRIIEKEEQIVNLEFNLQTLKKVNERLTEQMEFERKRAKELIEEFGTTRRVEE